MLSRSLWQEQDKNDDRHGKHQRRDWAAQFQAALRNRLVEEIADRRAKGAREDERRPEQSDAVHPRHEEQDREQCQRSAENQRAPE